MNAEKDLARLLETMEPKHQKGDYVFCHVRDSFDSANNEAVMTFKEEEGMTLIIRKEIADSLNLNYSFVAAWITLSVHSSLEAVGLTAAFSTALSRSGISCNVVAAFHHDHIFVRKDDLQKAMMVLKTLSNPGV